MAEDKSEIEGTSDSRVKEKIHAHRRTATETVIYKKDKTPVPSEAVKSKAALSPSDYKI
jgi:hypothetical protein